MQNAEFKMQNCRTALRLYNKTKVVIYVGDDAHIVPFSIYLHTYFGLPSRQPLRSGVHRTPAPFIVPFQSVPFIYCGRMWASAPTDNSRFR